MRLMEAGRVLLQRGWKGHKGGCSGVRQRGGARRSKM